MFKKVSLFIFTCSFLITTVCEPAFARAGGRSSFGGGRSSTSYFNQGSRGSRTFEGGGSGGKNYAPMQKTSTTGQGSANGAGQGRGAGQNAGQNSAQGAAQNAGQNYQQPNRAASFFQRNPMLSTFGTVLAASWLGSMIFGNHHSYASGMNAAGDVASDAAGTAGAGGGLLVNLLLMALGFFAVVMLVRYLTRGMSSQTQNNAGHSQENRAAISEIQLPESENKKFAEILVEVQNAWSNQDLEQLKKLTTPEMLKYFSDSLRQNISQDIANKVENVELISLHVNESWREDEMEYATAILEWSAFDYMVNLNKKPSDGDYIAEGNEKIMVITSEAWTFARYGSQGKWILSAIAQIE